VGRKPLRDAGACGVRLGVPLRAEAEQAAFAEGMCLSHWIRRVVEEAVSKSGHKRRQNVGVAFKHSIAAKENATVTALDSAFDEEMGKLNDR
jgi:hypothetical protein